MQFLSEIQAKFILNNMLLQNRAIEQEIGQKSCKSTHILLSNKKSCNLADFVAKNRRRFLQNFYRPPKPKNRAKDDKSSWLATLGRKKKS